MILVWCFSVLVSFVNLLSCFSVKDGDLPTNYQYFTSDGIKSGLNASQPTFFLNGKEIFVYSGALHYFRVPRQYWKDRLRRIRAAGLNAVETYVPWNLHEPQIGSFDFGNGGSDMEEFLHLEEFLTIAKEEDLFVIVRPGPYICAEFEFGGLPSWLLREKGIKWRTSDGKFMKHVTRYFNVVMPILAKYQFTKGGPIIAFQVENEYGNFGGSDKEYLKQLRQLMLNNGIVELLVTSDNTKRGTQGTIPELFLMTVNFGAAATERLNQLKSFQPGKPLMAMEFWTGWFDLWGNKHQGKGVGHFSLDYESILIYPASANLYMFEGGSNFGFLNGASGLSTGFKAVTSSYDYDAPLTENGDYGKKYNVIKKLLSKYSKVKTKLPAQPAPPVAASYSPIKIQSEIKIENLLGTLPRIESDELVPMEMLDINNGSGQSYGYIVYRKSNINLPPNSILKMDCTVSDVLIVLVNGRRVASTESTIILNNVDLPSATIDLVVENLGRVNSGHNLQHKGLWNGKVTINNNAIEGWTIFPLEFKKSWTQSLSGWENFDAQNSEQPKLLKSILNIAGSPCDTFMHMENWNKGIVIVNNFVLGRYNTIGPQQTLYLPGPFLRSGQNEILIFEHYAPADEIRFVDTSILTVNH